MKLLIFGCKYKHMKHTLSFLLLLSCCATLISCEGLLDTYFDRKEEQNYVSTYQGVYKGTYSGDEAGSLIIEISKNGAATISRTNASFTETADYSGRVWDDGSLQSVVFQSGFRLYGNLHQLSGTWQYNSWSGTWTLKKQ